MKKEWKELMPNRVIFSSCFMFGFVSKLKSNANERLSKLRFGRIAEFDLLLSLYLFVCLDISDFKQTNRWTCKKRIRWVKAFRWLYLDSDENKTDFSLSLSF